MIYYAKGGLMAYDEDANALLNPYDLVVIDLATGLPPASPAGQAYVIEEVDAREGWFRAAMPHGLPFESVRYCGRSLAICRKSHVAEDATEAYRRYFLLQNRPDEAAMPLMGGHPSTD